MQLVNRLGLIQPPTNESLDLRNGRQTVWHRLVLLDLTDDLSGTNTLGEINMVLGALQVIRVSVLDHNQIGKVHTDKGDTGWVGRMEFLTIIGPGLCRVGDGLEGGVGGHDLGRDQFPGPLEAVDWGKGQSSGCCVEQTEVVELAQFLYMFMQ